MCRDEELYITRYLNCGIGIFDNIVCTDLNN